jgi:hypothetical protein
MVEDNIEDDLYPFLVQGLDHISKLYCMVPNFRRNTV